MSDKVCPHIVQGAEGTAYCGLAESSVRTLQSQLDASMRAQETLAENVNAGLLENRTLQSRLAAAKAEITKLNSYINQTPSLSLIRDLAAAQERVKALELSNENKGRIIHGMHDDLAKLTATRQAALEVVADNAVLLGIIGDLKVNDVGGALDQRIVAAFAVDHPGQNLLNEREQLRKQFQNETLRTSQLTQMLLEFVAHHKNDHTPGPWSRDCSLCGYVKRAEQLLATPINALPPLPPPSGGRWTTDRPTKADVAKHCNKAGVAFYWWRVNENDEDVLAIFITGAGELRCNEDDPEPLPTYGEWSRVEPPREVD